MSGWQNLSQSLLGPPFWLTYNLRCNAINGEGHGAGDFHNGKRRLGVHCVLRSLRSVEHDRHVLVLLQVQSARNLD